MGGGGSQGLVRHVGPLYSRPFSPFLQNMGQAPSSYLHTVSIHLSGEIHTDESNGAKKIKTKLSVFPQQLGSSE